MPQPLPTRRRFLTRTLAAGTATLFAPTLIAACGEAEKLLGGSDLGDIHVPDVALPDLTKLLETLTLDERYLIADLRSGRFYRLDPEAHTVAQLNADLSERWTFGGLGAESEQLNFPTSVLPLPDGSVAILDAGNARVAFVSADGAVLRHLGGSGGDEPFKSLRGAVIDDDGQIWVSDPHDHAVKGFTADGSPVRTIGELGEEAHHLNAPRGLALDADGRLHVVDSGHARVQVYERDGTFVRSYGGYGLDDGRHLLPRGIAIAPNGLVYVCDPTAGAVQVYDKSGTALARLDDLSVAGKSAVPLDVSLSANGLVQVRLHTWSAA